MISVDSTPLTPSSATPSSTNERLIEMWVHGLSPQTQDRYRRTARRFLAFVNKPLHLVTLADIQGWQLTLKELSPSSQRTVSTAVEGFKVAWGIGTSNCAGQGWKGQVSVAAFECVERNLSTSR